MTSTNEWQVHTILNNEKPLSVDEPFGDSPVRALLVTECVDALKDMFGTIITFTMPNQVRLFAEKHGFDYVAVRQQLDIPSELYVIP